MARNRLEFRVSVKDDASANLQRISRETDALTSSFKRLAGAAVSIATVGEIVKLADNYRLLQNRLRLVTKSTEELKVVTNELVAVSLRSRTSFQSTADLYARVARSSRTLGLSQQELIDFTETVSKSIRISGSTSQEAAAGVIQFGQALASSRLSGDELRSVLEQMPRLAQAIAEGMGVGIGRLRELGEAGELTANKVLDALRKAAPAIAAEFARLVPILQEAFTNLETSVQVSIGRFDEMFGITTALAAVVIELADEIELMSSIMFGTSEEGEELSATMQRIAIFAIVAGTALQIMGRSLLTMISIVGGGGLDILDTFIQQMIALAHGDLDQAADLGRALAERLGEGWQTALVALESDIRTDATDAVEAIMLVLGNLNAEIAKLDLNRKDPPEGGLSKNERAAIIRATKSLINMKDALILQNKAILLVKESGKEYAEALKIVKIEALAAAAGNVQLGNDLKSLLDAFLVNKQAFSDEAVVEALATELNLLRQTAEARFINIKLSELSANASKAQMDQVAAAAAAIFDLQEAARETLSFNEKLAERAAQNIQDSFAEFLFDPFEEGLRGMVLGFINALRTMLSQMLSFKILSSIPAFGEFFSAAGRASGGPVTAGQPVLVGERGPEIFIPGASGTVMNNTASKASGGAPTFVTNIDARGADPGLIARIPAIMEQRDRQLMIKVKEFVETGSVLI